MHTNTHRVQTYVASSNNSIPTGTHHGGPDSNTPPVRLGAGGMVSHGHQSLLQLISYGASG